METDSKINAYMERMAHGTRQGQRGTTNPSSFTPSKVSDPLISRMVTTASVETQVSLKIECADPDCGESITGVGSTLQEAQDDLQKEIEEYSENNGPWKLVGGKFFCEENH